MPTFTLIILLFSSPGIREAYVADHGLSAEDCTRQVARILAHRAPENFAGVSCEVE